MAQNSLFPIDPVKTDLTAPVSSVQVQSPLDTTLTTTTRSAGIQNFSDALTKLAVKKQANDIHNDTITAQLAAAYEQEMPGGLEPEAQFAYTRAVDLTTKRKVLQQMEDFLAIEGSDILHDERMDRKTRATSFKNQLLGLLNLGKGSISQANAAEMFSDMDAMFDKVMSAANVALAKDKKQEVLTTVSSAIRQTVNEHTGFMADLAPKVSDTDALGNELSPAQFAKNQKEFSAGWLAKHINSKWFNAMVKQIARTNTGASIEDIKATALTIVGDELLKRVAKNPEIVQEKLMADIIANVPGSVKGTTLQDEIDSRSTFGKTVDTINKEFKRNLKSTLDGLDTDQTAADDARDDRIANYIQDGISDGSIKTEKEGLAHARAINDPSDQRQVENHVKKHFSGDNKKDIGHADYGPLVKYGAENFYNAATDRFDSVGFYAYAGEQGFKTSAIKTAAEDANPQTKRGKRRKEFFDQEPIKQLTSSFDNILKKTLEQYDLLSKYNKLATRFGDDKVSLNDPLVRKKLGITGEIGLKIRRVLDAQIALGATLESIIRDNPDVPVYQLVPEAQKAAKSLMQDAITGKPFGTSLEEIGKEKKEKTTEEKIVEGQDKHNPELKDIPSVEIINSKKGFFSTDKDAKEDYVARAIEELKDYDTAKAELVKIQKEFKGASATKRATIIANVGANPENLRVPSEIREIAELVNPDPAVRRHLAALKLSGQTKIQQPMKLERPSAWKQLADFISILPKKISEDLAEVAKPISRTLTKKSREIFGKREEVKPKEVTQPTTNITKPVGQIKTKEIKPSEVSPKEPSPDKAVSSRVSDVGIKPFSPTLETFSEDFIGETDTRKGLQPIKKEKEKLEKSLVSKTIEKAKREVHLLDTKLSKKVKNIVTKLEEHIDNAQKRNIFLDEYIKLRSGATAIKAGVKSLANMDSRILDFTKSFFDDPDLKDVWGSEKTITSGGRTNDPESGHFDDDINEVVAMDVRNTGWVANGGKSNDLIEKLGRSAKKKDWVINPTKEGKTYIQRKDEYWMKLSKGKEIRFIEVVDYPNNHVHYHIDANHNEPEGRW